MQDLRPIVRLLQNQRWISGTEICKITGYCREGLEQGIAALRARGLPLEYQPESGYRLMTSVRLIDERRLTSFLKKAGLISATRVSIVDAIDSTNSWLMDWADIVTLHGRVCIAEYQSSGRGRQGRSWYAAGYQNLTLSMAWRIEQGVADLSTVSLVAGLAVCNCLEEIGVPEIFLKWPNDVMSPVGKLAGILVETKFSGVGCPHVVIGIGINIYNASAVKGRVEQPVADLEKMVSSNLDRTYLSARLLSGLSSELGKMNQTGFSDYAQKWNERDAYMGYGVVGRIGRQKIQGEGLGVDEFGAYRVRDEYGRTHRLISGEVQLRRTADNSKVGHYAKIKQSHVAR
jgi:BirA family biotin operon repressor/biotin-[acetyl-CoA-carboxylase] ligase